MRQLYRKQRRAQGVQPEISSNGLVDVFRLPAMRAQHPGSSGQRLVVGHYHAAFSEAAQILGRKEAEGPAVADRSRWLRSILRAQRLRGVLDYMELMLPGQRH